MIRSECESVCTIAVTVRAENAETEKTHVPLW